MPNNAENVGPLQYVTGSKIFNVFKPTVTWRFFEPDGQV